MYVRGLYQQRRSASRSIAPKLRILKNLFILSISTAMVSGGFAGLRTYYSISDEVLAAGPLSISLLHSSGAFSAIYGSIVARRLTYKFTFVLTYFPYVLFLGAIAYTRNFITYPVFVLVGLVQGPLWNAAVAYVINSSAQFAYFSLKSQDRMVVQFLSVFSTVLGCGYMVGHLFPAVEFNALDTARNRSYPIVDHRTSSCGCWYCSSDKDVSFPDKLQSNLSSLTSLKELSGVVPVYSLAFYAGNFLLAPLLSFFLLDKLTVQLCSQTNKRCSARQLLAEFLQVFQDHQLHSVFPILVLIGLGEAFAVCDFSKGYVKCSASASSEVGYVMLCHGCVSTLFSASLCTVIRHIKRLTVVMAGLLCHLGDATDAPPPTSATSAPFLDTRVRIRICNSETSTSAMRIFSPKCGCFCGCYKT